MKTRNVEEEFKAAWTRAGMLPAAQQLSYRAKLTALRKRSRRPAVGGEGDEWEWDLTLANELDRIYTAVSDRAGVVYRDVKGEAANAIDATAAGAAKLGLGLVPMALVACALLYFYANTKERVGR